MNLATYQAKVQYFTDNPQATDADFVAYMNTVIDFLKPVTTVKTTTIRNAIGAAYPTDLATGFAQGNAFIEAIKAVNADLISDLVVGVESNNPLVLMLLQQIEAAPGDVQTAAITAVKSLSYYSARRCSALGYDRDMTPDDLPLADRAGAIAARWADLGSLGDKLTAIANDPAKTIPASLADLIAAE